MSEIEIVNVGSEAVELNPNLTLALSCSGNLTVEERKLYVTLDIVIQHVGAPQNKNKHFFFQ